jgi:2-polyprenyl-3-methyl-5-hydroxy-6-metoxy-1,4-benzoquinol methylase
MRMMSTAGQSGFCRESTGNGGMLNDRQLAQAVRHAPARPGQDETDDYADHAARYLKISELVQRHLGQGTVLDVGCGGGRLFYYLTEHAGLPAHCYTGIDSCNGAVRLAAARFPQAGFARRDYGCESVASRFDCVIFNDSLHCFDHPAAVLDNCVERNMHACSLLIICTANGQHDALLQLLAERYRPLDEQAIADSDGSLWIVQALGLSSSRANC